MKDQFSILPALKPDISKKEIKLIAKLRYFWDGDYLPFAYSELAPSEMSTIFNNTASQRKAAFIKKVKQGFVQQCLQHRILEHPTFNTPKITAAIVGTFFYHYQKACVGLTNLHNSRSNKPQEISGCIPTFFTNVISFSPTNTDF